MGKKKKKIQNNPSAEEHTTSRSGILRSVSVSWLILLAGFVLGVFVYGAKVWPYSTLKEIVDFVSGHAGEQTSVVEKMVNDLDIKPARHIEQPEGLGQYTPNSRAREIKGLPIKPRRKNPRMFLSKKAHRGYRAIYGVFDFKASRHGAVLIDPDGNIANVWHASQENMPWPFPRDTNIYPQGFEISPDGSIVVAFDGGTSLIKYDYCGKQVWANFGGYHHSITLDGEGALWTWGDKGVIRGNAVQAFGRNLMKVDYKSGKVLKMYHLMQVINANPLIDIFNILQDDDGPVSKWLGPDPGFFWHVNDIDPLPRELAKYYPQFQAGDLLVSLRAPDLIYVMDPDTMKVKWWRQGLTRRQHDPDWNDLGTITIFNNNMNRSYSNIMELDPKTMEYRVLVDGAKYGFYSQIRGNHQYLTDGGVLITSSTQGRVFEVDKKGNVVFEFLNVYETSGEKENAYTYLGLSEAKFLPEGFFEDLPKCN
jgi:hypothetical protein